MKRNTIAFIAVSDYDNLGVGYMASLLSDAGFTTRIIDSKTEKEELFKTLQELDPLIVGFSIIFLNYINHFIELIKYLRQNGINCHFTAGGHYASLRYEEVFQILPEIDSIIRFEGEYPMLELANRLSKGENWKNIDNISFKENDRIIANPVQPPENDLDKFPYPQRSALQEYAFQKKFTTILAGRGCIHNCSFCNTREFYRKAKGPAKRVRKPEMVVAEMDYLYHKEGCSVFIFHDDDFPVRSKNNWVIRFCSELKERGLSEKIIWKINCRVDDINEDIFMLMKKNGLYLVFIGLEDGTDSGLNALNKQMSVAKSVQGIKILKKLNIGFDFGFMLFQPETTFNSLNENIGFLRQVCGDGYTPVTFLRLVPLYDTRIEKDLRKQGRLIAFDGFEDYVFLEESMNRYYDFIMDCFTEWLRFPEGVENISKWARNYCSVYMHYFDDLRGGIRYYRKIRSILSGSNIFLLDNLKELADIFSSGSYNEKILLDSYREKIKSKNIYFKNQIINTMAKLLTYSEAGEPVKYI
jgi:anaerobic magnesium-protoporphyrin IX monomethyl ester cyclase